MIELFENISEKSRKQAEFIFDMAMLQPNISSTLKVLNDYTDACFNEEEKQFVEFYFNLRMENLLNGNFNDKR